MTMQKYNRVSEKNITKGLVNNSLNEQNKERLEQISLNEAFEKTYPEMVEEDAKEFNKEYSQNYWRLD